MTEIQPKPKKGIFQRFRTVGAIVLAVVLLAYVISQMSLNESLDILRSVDWKLLTIAISLNAIMLGMMAYRWYILYAIYPEQRPTFGSLLNASFIAIFFNNFLPSTLGGDGYRVYHAARTNTHHGLASAFSVVFVDRIIGLIALVLINLISVVWHRDILLENAGHGALWLIFFMVMLPCVFLLSLYDGSYRLVLGIMNNLPIPKRDWIAAQIEKVRLHLTLYSQHTTLILSSLVISLILRAIWLLSCFYVGAALHYTVPIYAYFVFVPLIELIRMIPITIQGIGVREGLFVLFFAEVGLSATEATLLAVLIYLLLNVNGVVGGILYLIKILQKSKK